MGAARWCALAAGVLLCAPAPARAEPVSIGGTAAPPAPPTVTDTAAPVSALPSAIRISGYVQADAVAYDRASTDEVDPSTGAPLNQTRLLIRRARLRVDVDHGRMGGSLELDANTIDGARAGIIDAEVNLRARPPALDDARRAWGEVGIGLVRIPWGYEIGERDQDRLFLERSNVSRALFPGTYDLGLRVRAGWRFLALQLALMNGDPLAESSFPARDPNRAKDLVGRIGTAGARGRVTFAAGLSGLAGTGFHRGTPETKDLLVWRDQNEDGLVQLSEIQIIAGSAATPSENFDRFAVGADARITIALPRLGTLGLFVEGMLAANLDRALRPADPVATGRDLRERGWVVGIVQELGAHAAAGLRYDRYDPDADASEQQAVTVVPIDASFATWTATVAYRATGLDRITLEYQHVSNPLGRSPSGAPATLGGDTLALRGQLAW